MFRNNGIKQNVAIKEIDPTRYRETLSSRVLKSLLTKYKNQSILLKGKPYPAATRSQQSEEADVLYHFSLTHTLVKKDRIPGSHLYNYDVVAKEYYNSENVIKYSTVGRLSGSRATFRGDNYGQLHLRITKPVLLAELPKEMQVLVSQALLTAYAQNGQTYFKSGENELSIINDEGLSVNVSFYLPNSLLIREREHHPHQLCFEEVGAEIGRGAFSTVYRSVATFAINADGSLRQKKSQSHAVKIQTCEKESALNRINDEYVSARRLPYMHVKKPIFNFTDNQSLSFSVSRFFPGFELNDLIVKDRNAKTESGLMWTTHQRLLLTRELLYGLLSIHKSGVIHQDVKPHNVLLGGDKDFPVVRFIDFGLSKIQRASTSGKRLGTSMYMSPEAWQRSRQTDKSDIYSMGILLRKLWHGVEETKTQYNLNRMTVLSYPERYSEDEYKQACKRSFDGMFENIPDLIQVEQDALYNLITNMCEPDPVDRRSLEEGIHDIESLIMARVLEHVASKHRSSLENAFKSGEYVRQKLELLFASNPKTLLSDIVDLFTPQLRVLSSHKEAIKLFCFATRIRALQGITTVNGLVDVLNNIIDDYSVKKESHDVVLKALGICVNEFIKAEDDSCYHSFLSDMYTRSFEIGLRKVTGIDHMIELTDKLDKDAVRINDQLTLATKPVADPGKYLLPYRSPVLGRSSFFAFKENQPISEVAEQVSSVRSAR